MNKVRRTLKTRLYACVTAAMLCASLARADITLGPGETLDWNASTPSADAKITATGGTIIFNSDTEVGNNFYLGGEKRKPLIKWASRGVCPCSVYSREDD